MKNNIRVFRMQRSIYNTIDTILVLMRKSMQTQLRSADGEVVLNFNILAATYMEIKIKYVIGLKM